MEDWILDRELGLRVGIFAVVFGVMASWELLASKRELVASKAGRWRANLGLMALNAVLLRGIVPVTAIAAAWVAAERGWGVLNVIEAPYWASVLITVVVLDFTIYVQHVLFHAVPLLWRLHLVHHADLDLDVTSGTRFHPLEMLVSLLIKLGVIVVLGAPALGALAFEVILFGMAMFNHANVRLPARLDGLLRLCLVTPDMHRVHHSIDRRETTSNFGFNLSWWDRLLGTYWPEPRAGHLGMTIGLAHLQHERRQPLPWMLTLPFVVKLGGYAMGGRGSDDRASAEGGGTDAARRPRRVAGT